MAEFRSQRAIALMAGHGAVAFKCADLMFPNSSGATPPNALAVSGGLLGACWGALLAFRSLQVAGDKSGDEARYARLERDSMMMLVAMVIGVVGAVSWTPIVDLLSALMNLISSKPAPE